MQAAVNALGPSAIAGYTAATKVDQFSVLMNNAIGIATANYVAQNYGAKLYGRIRAGVRAALFQLTTANVLMAALMLVFLCLSTHRPQPWWNMPLVIW